MAFGDNLKMDKLSFYTYYLSSTGLFAESFEAEAQFKFGVALSLKFAGRDDIIKEIDQLTMFGGRKERPTSIHGNKAWVQEFLDGIVA